jgi:hypothetical protein
MMKAEKIGLAIDSEIARKRGELTGVVPILAAIEVTAQLGVTFSQPSSRILC